ncbi:hypothetical protein OROHE_018434 [Orobanche hederae]
MEEDDNSTAMRKKIIASSAAVVMSASIAVIGFMSSHQSIPRERIVNMEIERAGYINSLINRSNRVCLSQLRMSKVSFHMLCETLAERNLLKPTLHVPVEHQVVLFLHALAHNVRNCTIGSRFFRSGETVSRYFNSVLAAILTLRDEYLVQPRNDSPTPEKIVGSERYWPWFKDCVGAIDGTHVRAVLPVSIQGRFRSRKDHPTQNVLAAHDSLIWDDALRRRNGLVIPHGKYYLVDGGYGIRKGFIPPYRGVRYHVREYSNHEPENKEELFNLRHSSIRTTIERAFGVLKIRFPLLDTKKYLSYRKQIDVVIAACVLHNYIMCVDPNDTIFMNAMAQDTTVNPQRERTTREVRNESSEWSTKRDAIAQAMYADYTSR